MTDILIPEFTYRDRTVLVAAGVNDTIRFRDVSGGGDLTATLEAGRWTTEQLCLKVKEAMDGQSNARYNCAYLREKNHFKVETGGTFLELEDGSPSSNNAWDTHLGFTGGDKTGATSYESDAARPGLVTVTMTERLRSPIIERAAVREDFDTESGARYTTHMASSASYRFRMEFEGFLQAQKIHRMKRDVLIFGDRIELQFDSLTANSRMFGTIDPKTVVVREMVNRKLYRLYELRFSFVRRVPRVADLVTAVGFVDVLDRGPTS